MAREREVKVTVLGDSSSGQRALKQLDDQADRTEGKFSKLSGAFGKLAGPLAAAFAGAKVLEFAGEMQSLGVELETMGKKAATVFEGSTGAVTDWAKQNASAMGITDDKLRSLAASFGDLLKPMGFTSSEAADMSTKVVGLSGALSAWSGGTRSAAEVSQILAKAMLGERDGLKELGISISDADVKQRLMEKGQKDLTGAALQQATALATQELIFEKSADAQKAWADGSMDAVKKQNALKEKLAELREDLATKLKPAFAALLTFLVDKVIPAFEQLVGWVQQNWPRIKEVITETMKTVQAHIDAAMKFIQGIIKVVTGIIKGDWGQVWEGIKQILAGAWDFMMARVQLAIDIVKAILSTAMEIISAAWSSVWNGIKDFFAGVWIGFFSWPETGSPTSSTPSSAWLV